MTRPATSRTVRRWKKRPIALYGVQWTGDNAEVIAAWCGEFFRLVDGDGFTAEVYDFLHDNWPRLRTGDWVFQGLRGEFYPVEAATFGDVYEPDPVS